MPLQRIEVNVQTGERKVIDLTPQEEAEAIARTAAEAAKPPSKSEGARMVDAILSDPQALAALKAQLA